MSSMYRCFLNVRNIDVVHTICFESYESTVHLEVYNSVIYYSEKCSKNKYFTTLLWGNCNGTRTHNYSTRFFINNPFFQLSLIVA